MAEPSLGAVPQGTAFTYQGQLKRDGLPLTDSADFEFTLWDTASAGNQVGPTVSVSNVAVDAGLFIVKLDFRPAVFNGDARWLQVAVRSPHSPFVGPLTPLSPRQLVSAAPYALKAIGVDGHSLDAADGVPADAVFVD